MLRRERRSEASMRLFRPPELNADCRDDGLGKHAPHCTSFYCLSSCSGTSFGHCQLGCRVFRVVRNILPHMGDAAAGMRAHSISAHARTRRIAQALAHPCTLAWACQGHDRTEGNTFM
eukprot:1600115-Pleurochrysis_carterae.AAC.1